MNKIILIGRIGKDIETRTTTNGVVNCAFPLAVERSHKDANGERVTDWFNVVAWRGTAEFIARYFRKGGRIALTGAMQCRTYTAQDGNPRTVWEMIVDTAEFVESNNKSEPKATPATAATDFEAFADDEELPF